MADEETVVDGAETEAVVEAAVETQGGTPEVKATETTTTEAAPETTATEPERITRAEAEALAKAEAAKAVAELQRKYDSRLQDNAHNAKLADTLDRLKDHLEGKKPVDPNALPEGFDYLPEGIQKHLLNQTQTVRTLQEKQAIIDRQNAENAEKAIRNNVEAARVKLATDPKNGKLFESVQEQIANDIQTKPHIRNWVRAEPEEALSVLFAKYAPAKIAEVTAQAAASKATAGVRASSKPSSMGGGAPVRVSTDDTVSAADKAWEMHGEKILQDMDAR